MRLFLQSYLSSAAAVMFDNRRGERPFHVDMEKSVVLEERDETEIKQPDIEKTRRALGKGRGWQAFALTALLILACVYSLYFAEAFLAPVVLAVVFNFFLSPSVRALAKIRVPEAAGAALVMLAGLAVFGFMAYELAGPLSDWVNRAPDVVAKISTEVQRFKKPVEKVTQASEQVSKIAEVTDGDSSKKRQQVAVARPAPFGGFVSKTRDVAWGIVVFFVMLYFLLSSGDLFLRKLIHVLPRLEDKKRAVLIMRDIENNISKYLITVAMINAGLGLAGGLAFWALGMPNPGLWGAFGFLLNFIPFLGALAEIVIVGVAAIATFPGLGHALLIPAAYFGLAVIEANLVTPYIMGRRMTLNPVVVFVAVTFGGFLWGILGIFLAVPALVMLKIFCDHIEPLAPIGEFLGY